MYLRLYTPGFGQCHFWFWEQVALTEFDNMQVMRIFALMESKSLYRSHAGRHFYGTENVIWAGFGLIGNTEKKKFGPIMSNF